MYYLSANFFSFTWEVDLLQCRSLPSLSYNVPLLSRKKKKKRTLQGSNGTTGAVGVLQWLQ